LSSATGILPAAASINAGRPTPASVASTAARPVFAGPHDEALGTLEAVQKQSLWTDYARGIALRGVGRMQDTLDAFERILSVEPGHAGALEDLADDERAELGRRRLRQAAAELADGGARCADDVDLFHAAS